MQTDMMLYAVNWTVQSSSAQKVWHWLLCALSAAEVSWNLAHLELHLH